MKIREEQIVYLFVKDYIRSLRAMLDHVLSKKKKCRRFLEVKPLNNDK